MDEQDFYIGNSYLSSPAGEQSHVGIFIYRGIGYVQLRAFAQSGISEFLYRDLLWPKKTRALKGNLKCSFVANILAVLLLIVKY